MVKVTWTKWSFITIFKTVSDREVVLAHTVWLCGQGIEITHRIIHSIVFIDNETCTDDRNKEEDDNDDHEITEEHDDEIEDSDVTDDDNEDDICF